MSQHPQLDNSFLESRKQGIPDEVIRTEALKSGWTKEDIDAAFATIQGIPAAAPSPVASTSPISSVSPTYNAAPVTSGHKVALVSIIVFLIILVLSGGAYAYVAKIGPFSRPPYDETDLVSGILGKISQIKSSTYKATVNIYAEPREADAEPFVIKNSDPDFKKKYARDVTRAERVQDILSNFDYEYSEKTFPASLKEVNKPSDYRYSVININDPLTQSPFEYRVTEGGSNFELKVTFETDAALAALKESSSRYVSLENGKTTSYEGKTVTFTKNSYNYFFISSTPPKSFIEELADYAEYASPETNITASVDVTAALNGTNEPSAWKFTFDGSGNLGDLIYKINIEARKKDKDYFLRINNIPTLFSSYLPPKGQWIKFRADEAESDYQGDMISSSISGYEQEYSESREEIAAFIKKAIRTASEEKLIEFKSAPYKEKVADGRTLYRYDVTLRKEAIIPFYEKLSKDDTMTLVDTQYLEYLKSPEFSEAYDYYNKNTALTIWVDKDGFPVIAKYAIRIVPAADIVALKDKQFKLEFVLNLNDINKPILIEAPEGAKTYDEVMGSTGNSLETARTKAKSAAMKSMLANLRAQSEIVYDKTSSYGTKAFPLGECTKTAGTLFGDDMVYQNITDALKNTSGTATCVSTTQAYAISMPLPEKEGSSYCVDSSGYATEIDGAVTSTSCI